MKAKRSEYEIKATYEGKVTGRMFFRHATRGEVNAFARKHSRYWKSRTVHVLAGNFPLASFERGKEVRLQADQATL